MLHNYLRHALPFCWLFLLTGCSFFNADKQPEGTIKTANEKVWQQHQQKIAQLNIWQISGKAGIKTADDSGSASLFWLQQFTSFDIRLSGPLGRGATRIIGDTGQVTIDIAGQGRFTASTAEELVKQQLGWNLPVSHLTWWIKGLPAPDSPYTNVLNNDSRLEHLYQDNWSIEYKAYQELQGYWLPQRIIAKSSDIQIILVIKQWNLTPSRDAIASK